MALIVHVDGAPRYAVGDEIWHQALADAIVAEAETIAAYAGPELLDTPGRSGRKALRDRVVAEMTAALRSAGDRYRAPDGVLYSLVAEQALDRVGTSGTLIEMSPRIAAPAVEEVLRFESLPLGSTGTRRAIVRWSDGTESPAMTWYEDEILVCEGDLIGKTGAEIRSLHFRRDRDWLQS
jgi:hypothetical protein